MSGTAKLAGDLCFQSATSLIAGYRQGDFTPVEVMRSVFARIDALNPAINAIVTLARDQALAAAEDATRALRRPDRLGALHGVPVSVKDVTPTLGLRTTYGSRLFAEHVPDCDNLAVERLKKAGAIVIGKTNTPEFAAGGHTVNELFGPTRNPWNTALSAGGSSGGAAAAVATGMGPIAEGSDLGGSLRTPAAFCGVVGLRPSPGLVPIHPSINSWDTLTVQGPIARTTADIGLMLSVMAGRDDRDPLSYDVDPTLFATAAENDALRGARIAWTPDLNGLLPVEGEIAAVAERATHVFTALGAQVDAACPAFDELEEIVLATRGIAMVAAHGDKLAAFRDVLQPGLVWNVDQGLSLTAAAIAKAALARTRLWQRVQAFMQQYDFLVLPGTAVQPFPVDWAYPTEIEGVALANYMEWFYLTYAISITALPVISVPCGFSRQGLPVGLQIVGRRRGEARLLAAAAAFEAAAPWTDRLPSILHSTRRDI